MKESTLLRMSFGTTSPFSRTFMTAEGWISCLISRNEFLNISTWRITFGPPPVEPAMPPQKKSRKSTPIPIGGQIS